MSQSAQMRVMIGDDNSDSMGSNSILLAVMDCDLAGTEVFGTDTGSRGTRQRFSCGARKLGESVSGGFTFQPTVTQLDWLIERMMGDNIAGYPAGAATPQESMTTLICFVDKSADIYKYTKLRIASVTFSASEGDYLKVRVEFVGAQEVVGQVWPSGGGIATAYDCASEYVCSDIAFNVAAVAYPFKSISLKIDNMIEAQQENTLYPSVFEASDFGVEASGTFGVRADTIALYRSGVAGAAGSIVLADGTTTYTFTLANLKIPGTGIAVPDVGTITMDLAGQVYRTAGAVQLSIAKS